MTLPTPMPRLDASDKEWAKYMHRLTDDELWELMQLFERRYQAARKRRIELERHFSVVAAS